MGFYLRKSVRVGPLRFNFSKSGIGVSTGVRGFRIGTGPRGNYVHIGAGGLYYRATIPSGSASSPRNHRPTIVEQPTTHAPLEDVGSGSVARMVDFSSAGLLSELNQKHKRPPVWPFAIALGALAIGGLIAADSTPWLIAPVAIVSLIGVLCAYQFDLLTKSVVIFYEFEPDSEAAYQRVHECVAQIGRCGGTWHIGARGHVYDPKYHAGAGQLVSRKRIAIGSGQPPYVHANISVPFVPLRGRTLYFFPERVLVYSRDGIGAVGYHELTIAINDSRFIETESVPHDAKVVDQTWRYVNKDGGPDRRFNNNHQIPICHYEELWLSSPSGLNELIQVSRTGLGQQLDKAIEQIAELVIKVAAVPPPLLPSPAACVAKIVAPRQRVVPPAHTEHSEERESSQSPGPNRIFDVLLEILCCLMVANGRASGSEKKRIHDVMARLQSPWSDLELDNRIAAFVVRVQVIGYRRTLSNALNDVPILKHAGMQDVLLKFLDSVAHADGKLSDGERQLCERVKAVLGGR